MYQAFVAVLHDLLLFVVQGVRDFFAEKPMSEASNDREGVRQSTGTKAGVDLGYVVYVQRVTLPCYAQSRLKGEPFATFPYGDRLQQTKVLDDAVFVTNGSVEGWVAASGVTAEYEQVFPVLVPSMVYDASHKEVVKVRKYLNQFSRKSKQMLSAEEFVLYTLQSTGVTIPWEAINASFPLSWYQRLLGRRGVTVTDEPKTHSVLEYTTSTGDSVQGYVAEVHPNHTIMLESVGRVEPGEYRVEQVSPQEWRTWQPSFITFQ